MLSSDTKPSFTLSLADATATARLGAALSPLLGAGDTVLLDGPLGAGKSALARAVIRAALGRSEGNSGEALTAEIPSPSYTLVNVYDTRRGPIWHADLYRLSGAAEELEELGLDEAIGSVLVLVEWPGRLGAAVPARRIDIAMSVPAAAGRSDGREVELTLRGPGWDAVAALLAGWE